MKYYHRITKIFYTGIPIFPTRPTPNHGRFGLPSLNASRLVHIIFSLLTLHSSTPYSPTIIGMLPTTPSPDWTTVSSRNRAPTRPTAPSDAHGSTLRDDGNRRSRGRSARGRGGGTLTTIHEDGSHTRSRSLVTPPIPRHSAGPQTVTLMTSLHTAPPTDHHPPAFKWPRPHRTRPLPSPSDPGKGGTTPPGGTPPRMLEVITKFTKGCSSN